MAKEINKVKTGANAVVFVLFVLGCLIAANLIFTRLFKRVDFTQDKLYTLSQPSKDLVAKLPDRMLVKAFISNDLQPPFSQTAQYVRDLLDEYKSASKGKFVWEAIDPGNDQKLEEEANKLKVPKMRRGRVSSNKVEIGASYLGVAFEYGGQVESIPEINGPEGLEFQMTGLIKMMTVKKKKIAFATSEGELSTAQDPQGHPGGLSMLKQYMQDYDVTTVDLTKGEKPIGEDVDALVIAGPKMPMSERAKFVVDQFLMRGKSVALFVDGMIIEQPRNMQIPGMESQPRIGRKNDTGTDDLLEHYGFKVRDDIVLEPRQNVPGPVPLGGQLFLANYPTFVAATKLDEKSSIMDHVKAVILPFTSSIEKVKDNKQPNVTVVDLAMTTPESWRQSGFYLYDPQNTQIKPGDDHGPFVLAVAATGKFKSFFAGKPYPNEKGEKIAPPDPNSSAAPGVERPLDEGVQPGRLVVVADSEFASDEYLRFARQVPVYASNMLFVMNMMDYLAQDEALAPLRAKVVQSRPLSAGKESTPALVKYGNVIGVPLLFTLFGVARWRMRNARRRSAKL